MKDWYQESGIKVLEEFSTSERGLEEEQVLIRRNQYGENQLQEGKKQTMMQIFLKQFQDLLVIILVIAAMVSFFSGNVESSMVILVVLLMNAILGTLQNLKAQKSLEGLKALSSPTVKLIRNGIKMELPSREVVPGDIMLLDAGDLVVADGRILQNYSLQINESALTGESTNVEKQEELLEKEVPLGDRSNMVYSGSLVTYGRGRVVVTQTGMQTEIGKIAVLLNQTKERKTPLQVSLDQFSSRLAVIIFIICGVVFGLSLMRGLQILDAMMFAVALAVAAIPEALSSIVTIVQAMGTQKMAQENAIIKDLKAVESLGCVSIICSDKTGTLTQNKMTVMQVYLNQEVLEPDQMNINELLHQYLLYNAILNNDSSMADQGEIGDPTESCLLQWFRMIMKDRSLTEETIRNRMERLEEIPFDSKRKMMSTKYKMDGVSTVFFKGAPDILINRCERVRHINDVILLEQQEKEEILRVNEYFSKQGLRVLAFAYRETDETLTTETEKNMVFLGMVAMMDPPRQESAQAVTDAYGAGIKTIMITGDHKVTASAIAKEIGILKEDDMAITGTELDSMSEDEFEHMIQKVTVYARVTPENKIRIVDGWQKQGQIVAMTGDGVNDAPALKKADIGIAMGITGTEVSKDAADMILADDNFATIIKAVANGRNVYQNIQNAILFLLSGNTAAILAVLYACLAGLATPFTAVQLLFMNLVTDSLPALAIGMEPGERNLLQEKPRQREQGILSKEFLTKVGIQGLLIAVVTMVSFYKGSQTNVETATTMAFLTLTLARLFHGFNCRSRNSLFRIGFSGNWYSLWAFLTGGILVLFLTWIPFLGRLFQMDSLDGQQFLLVMGLALLPTIFIQGYKVGKERKVSRA